MADSKITALTALTAADPANDMMPIVDVSDTSMAASGTTKRISINNILACSPSATLASLNVTGSSIPANGLYLPTTNTLEFSANSLAQYRIAPLGVFSWYDGAGGTRMTLNSTGLGIGRSPIAKLNVDKASQTPGGTTPNGAFVITDNVASNLALELGVNSASLPYIQSRNSTSATYYDLLINPNGGNVGIGVTPSAWGSGYKVIQGQIGGFALSNDNSSNNQFRLSSNAYFDTTDSRWEYYGSSTATAYEQRAGEHRFFNAVSGSAGNAITFTQAMTLNAAGSLVLGAAAVATTATDGFLYIPGCAGTPTGTPTAQTGRVPLVVDTTNNKLYFYSGGSWVAAN